MTDTDHHAPWNKPDTVHFYDGPVVQLPARSGGGCRKAITAGARSRESISHGRPCRTRAPRRARSRQSTGPAPAVARLPRAIARAPAAVC